MISNVRGQFTGVTGKLIYDPTDIAKSRVEASIDVASIDTRDPQRDTHLKSPDFFDVEKFPTLTFSSSRVTRKADGTSSFPALSPSTASPAKSSSPLKVRPRP
jgi:polyisoprenoid-binding protein YceI